MNLVLWDIDGTLMLSGGAGDRAMDRAFTLLHNTKDIWTIHPHGKTDIVIFKQLYQNRFRRLPTDTEIENLKKAYIEFLREELVEAPDLRLMPHVKETLEIFHSNPNICQGLATGNFEITGRMKLKRAGIDHYFSFGGFACDSEDRQTLTHRALEKGIAHIERTPERVYLIGDTVNDIRCGQGIGATTIGVCTCATPRADLEKAGADYVLSDLSEVNKIGLLS